LHVCLWRWWAHMLALRFLSFFALVSFAAFHAQDSRSSHVLGTRLLLALPLLRFTSVFWPCSFQRRYGLLALCTLPMEYFNVKESCSPRALTRNRLLPRVASTSQTD
jgi:hypothetical protein